MKDTNKTNTLLLTVIGVATLLVAVIGATFAYFTATLSGTESSTTITVGAGTLTISYANSSYVTLGGGDNQAVLPTKATCASGPWADEGHTQCQNVDATTVEPLATKTFTITGNNSTTSLMPYTITLKVTKNEFTANTLKYTLTSTNTGSNGTIVPSVSTWVGIATGASDIALGTGNFQGPTGSAKVHTYVLKIYFPDTYANQDTDKNKEFNAYVDTVVSQVS